MKNAGAKCLIEAKYVGINGEKAMINIKFDGKQFKIYANREIECLEMCEDSIIQHLRRLIEMIMLSYNNPSDGFPVSFLANRLANYDIEVLSYRDYEKENASPNTIY